MAEPARIFQSAGPDDLLALARQRFLQGKHIDLASLAEELAISRATAYRWAGNAEDLVGRVIAQLVGDTFTRLLDETRALRGAARILAIHERGMRYISAFKPLRDFLEADPQRGLRLIASKEGPVQKVTIALNQKALQQEIDSGNLALPVDTHTMAYALTRLGESFLYADLIAGEKPDIDQAVKVVGLMFRPGDTATPGRRPRSR